MYDNKGRCIMQNIKKENDNAWLGFAIAGAAIGILTLTYYIAKGIKNLYVGIFKAMLSPYTERDCEMFGFLVVLTTHALMVYSMFFMTVHKEKGIALLFIGIFCYFATTAILSSNIDCKVEKKSNIRENLPWLGY